MACRFNMSITSCLTKSVREYGSGGHFQVARLSGNEVVKFSGTRKKLRRSRRDELYDSHQAATRDAAFMTDMRGVAKDFKRAVADGLRDD